MSLLLPVTAPVATTALVLVQQPGNGDNGGQGEDFGKSSPLGFLILLLFLIAVALLVRSMTKHLKRLPASFDPEEQAAAEAAEADRKDEAETPTEEPVKQPEKSESS